MNLWSRRVSHAFHRAAQGYAKTAVLAQEVANRLCQRLDLIKLNPTIILDLGTGPGICLPLLRTRYPKATIIGIDLVQAMLQEARQQQHWWQRKFLLTQADAAQLPIATQKVDLIVANFLLPWCENIQSVFQECQRILAPNGLLLFSTLGPDTLKELRQSFANIDPTQGHVNNFLDMHDVGDQLLQAGCHDAVMDVEYFTCTYNHLQQGLKELQALGSCYLGTDRLLHLGNKKRWQQLLAEYEIFRDPQQQVLPCTVEVIYGHAWKKNIATELTEPQEIKVHFAKRKS